ncbi:MAG: hypothetical protein H0X30_06150 [Anaerolineae bacterium]|nr:hypothetical protein [Anaerolineae bacterium]
MKRFLVRLVAIVSFMVVFLTICFLIVKPSTNQFSDFSAFSTTVEVREFLENGLGNLQATKTDVLDYIVKTGIKGCAETKSTITCQTLAPYKNGSDNDVISSLLYRISTINNYDISFNFSEEKLTNIFVEKTSTGW